MLNRAEFEIGNKVTYWNGKMFNIGAITHLSLNPITNEIEYKVFHYVDNGRKKRGRASVRVGPKQIQESKHFVEPKVKKPKAAPWPEGTGL